ncbi:phosphohydrolase [Lapidilactobacillus concavus]|nr:HD domain-containing protein [Lapidilactobacillus concavus]GEL13732.1 phosphohydrolase [Lapidilactobacillus concavus]
MTPKVIQAFVEARMATDHSGHDVAHIQRVAQLCDVLLTNYPEADAAITMSAAWTHDILDDKLVADIAPVRRQLMTTYAEAGLTADQIAAITAITAHLSFSANLKQHYQLSLEGQIVQDADRLDALGAIGIGRAFYYGAHTGAPMYDPDIAPRTTMTKADYRQKSPVINHFYEKLFKLGDLMNTPEAKKIADERITFMQTFVSQFKSEWHLDNNF